MDPANHPGTDAAESPPALGSLVLLIGGLLLYFLLFDLLSPPRTWTRCPLPSPAELSELSDQRDDYLLVAVPLLVVYGVWVATRAWRWAADRRARQGYERRPGRLAHGSALLLGALWLVLLGDAFVEKASSAIFYGTFLAALVLVSIAALALAVVVGAFRSRTRPRSQDAADSLTVGLAWSVLLVGFPYLFLSVAVVGKDTTIWC